MLEKLYVIFCFEIVQINNKSLFTTCNVNIVHHHIFC